MKTLREISLITLRFIRLTLRNPVFLAMGVITPLTYVTLFAPLLKNLGIGDNVLNFFIPGMLPLIAFSTGIFTGFGMIDEIRSGVIERFRVTPSSRFAILASPVLHDALATLFQSLLFILIALPFGFRTNVVGLILLFVLLFLLTLITSAFGNALAFIVKSEDKYAPIVQGINLPIMLLSGVLLPMSLAPGWLSTIAHFNPVYYAVEAARNLSTGEIYTTNVLYAFLIIGGMAALTMNWATRVFRKAVT